MESVDLGKGSRYNRGLDTYGYYTQGKCHFTSP
jgi:hypothetical protein